MFSQRALSQGQRQLRCQARRLIALNTRTYSTPATATSDTPAPAEPAGAASSGPSAAAPTKAYKKAYAPAVKKASYTTAAKAAGAGFNGAALPQPAQYTPTTIAHDEGEPGAAGAQSAASEVPSVDWSRSFHGVSSQPVTARQFEALMRPLQLQDIEIKPDGVIYLPEIRYRRRLNEAFGPMGWGLIPKGETVVGDSIVTREYALVVGGRFVSQAQGENNYFGADQLPSAVEGCKSNALMRCCKDLGIASELWDPAFVRWFKKTHMEEVWVEHTTTKKKRTQWYRKGAVEVAYPYRQTK